MASSHVSYPALTELEELDELFRELEELELWEEEDLRAEEELFREELEWEEEDELETLLCELLDSEDDDELLATGALCSVLRWSSC